MMCDRQYFDRKILLFKTAFQPTLDDGVIRYIFRILHAFQDLKVYFQLGQCGRRQKLILKTFISETGSKKL